MRRGYDLTLSADATAADDGIYQARAALQAMKQELNERRDANLTEAELIALLEVYNEAGR